MAKPAFEIRKLECDAFDHRVVRRHIDSGRTTREELTAHTASLPDDAENAETITVSIGDDPETDETAPTPG